MELNIKLEIMEKYENFTPEMQAICDKYESIFIEDGLSYTDCADFLEEAESVGYSFEYGLDAEPFNFIKL